MHRLSLQLLGPPRIALDTEVVEIASSKAVALLTYLVVTRQPHSRDALATLFWPQNDQRSARAYLRTALRQIKRKLGDGWLRISRSGVDLHSQAAIDVDVHRFCEDVVGALRDPVDPERLAAAVDRYADDFLAGFTLPDAPAFDDWQYHQRDDLRRVLAGALERLVTHHRTGGNSETALPFAHRLLQIDPLDECAHRLLMELHVDAGQQTAALRQYEECTRILDEELGVEPSPETTALAEQIRSAQHDKETPADHPAILSSGHPVTASPPPTTSPHNPPPSWAANRSSLSSPNAWPNPPAGCSPFWDRAAWARRDWQSKRQTYTATTSAVASASSIWRPWILPNFDAALLFSSLV